MADTDVRFYFDPVCPFAWLTSKWVRMVAAQRDYTVDWRFISLRPPSPASPSSSGACAGGPSCAASACSPAQPEKRRTGTPAAARRHRSLGEATGVELHGKAVGDLLGG
jgi:hypothetical protein